MPGPHTSNILTAHMACVMNTTGANLTYQSEEQGQIWAEEMHSLLLNMNTAVKEAREQGLKQLNPTEVADWKAQYEALLQRRVLG